MGFLFKFLLFFIAIYLLLKAVGAWLLGKRGRQNASQRPHYRQTRREQPKQPEKQTDRIIDYQRKTFESSEVEDADFIEIKKK
ncbi:MAG: hypothetical protein GX371_00490 [Bacteroidales bacterium]|nr:hypothetical protein [Bacteroidales bacterium]